MRVPKEWGIDDSPANDFVMDFYISRIQQGWTLNEIDNTDILEWTEINVYKAVKEYHKKLADLDNSKY